MSLGHNFYGFSCAPCADHCRKDATCPNVVGLAFETVGLLSKSLSHKSIWEIVALNSKLFGLSTVFVFLDGPVLKNRHHRESELQSP